MTQSFSPVDSLDAALRALVEGTGARRGVVVLERGPGEWGVETEARREGPTVVLRPLGKPLEPGLAPVTLVRRAIERRATVLADDEAALAEDDCLQRAGTRWVLCLPVSPGKHVAGVVVLERDLAPPGFGPGMLALCEAVASQAAVSLENARLRADVAVAREFPDLVMSVLSHDLVSPLGAIMGLTQLILRKSDLPADVARRAAVIDASSKRIKSLIGTLFDFTQVRAGAALSIARTRVDLRSVCARAIAVHLAVSPDRAVVLDEGDPIEGAWDPVRMGQMIGNLLSNVVVYGDPAGPVHVSLVVRGGAAILAMQSVGAPFAPEPLPALFDPFRRSPADASRPRWLGVGLYVAKQVVAAHGGSIAAEASGDAGTVFTVRLPVLTETHDVA